MSSSLSLRIQNKLRQSFKNFYEGTTFHGFNDLGHAKTTIWKIVWCIILIMTTCVTIYHMTYAIEEYVYQKSITRVVPPDKGAVVYPTLGICYPHWIYWIDWDKAFQLGFSKETVLFGLSYMGRIYSPNEFDIEGIGKNFTQTMDQNGLKYLTEFYVKISRNFPLVIGVFPDWPELQSDPFMFKTKQIVYKGDTYQFCYTVSGQEIENVLDGRGLSSTLRRSRNLFNFSIQDPNYNLYSANVGYEEYNYYIAAWLCYESNYWVQTLDDFASNYTWYTMPVRLYPDMNTEEFVALKTDNEEYNIKMTPSVQRLRNTKEKPCQVGQRAMFTNQSCDFKCKADMDNKNSYCTYVDEYALFNLDTVALLCSYPINFLKYKRENPNFEKYPCDNFVPDGPSDKLRRQNMTMGPATSNQTTLTDKELEFAYQECSNKCSNVCEIWKYNINVNILTGSPQAMTYSFKNQTNINIYYPREEDVLIVIDLDSQSWQLFVAIVGNVLSLWTGVSLISFFQMVYLCFFYTQESSDSSFFGLRNKDKLKNAPVIFMPSEHVKALPNNKVEHIDRD